MCASIARRCAAVLGGEGMWRAARSADAEFVSTGVAGGCGGSGGARKRPGRGATESHHISSPTAACACAGAGAHGSRIWSVHPLEPLCAPAITCAFCRAARHEPGTGCGARRSCGRDAVLDYANTGSVSARAVAQRARTTRKLHRPLLTAATPPNDHIYPRIHIPLHSIQSRLRRRFSRLLVPSSPRVCWATFRWLARRVPHAAADLPQPKEEVSDALVSSSVDAGAAHQRFKGKKLDASNVGESRRLGRRPGAESARLFRRCWQDGRQGLPGAVGVRDCACVHPARRVTGAGGRKRARDADPEAAAPAPRNQGV